MTLPYRSATAQAAFVRRTKESIIENLKTIGPWPKDVKGWVVRIAHVDYMKGAGATFLVRSDIAAWKETAMFELATSTGRMFALPPLLKDLGVATHAWVERGNADAVILALKYDANKVLNGAFRVTRKNTDALVSEHFTAAR